MKKINTFFRGITFLMCLFSMTIYGQTFTDNDGTSGAIITSCDSGGDQLTIEVSGVPAGYALSQVGVDITHTWNDDIDIYLITPGGTTIELSTDNGSLGDGYDNVIFTDGAAEAITDYDSVSTILSGEYRPEEPLANAGTETNGTWTLDICDDTGGDFGPVNFWSLSFVEPPCFAATGVDASFDLDNCGFVNVNIDTVNDATSITDGTSTWAIAGAGITQVGPFAEGDSVTLSIIHSVSDCDFDLDTFDYFCPPTNDACSSAIALECDSTVTGSTVAATRDLSLGTCGTSLSTAPGVWYSITGTGGDITVDTIGSDYDTKLGVFTGSCGTLDCVGGNDDIGFPNVQSTFTFASTEGETYYIYVTGFSSNTGTYVLNVDCACAVALPACTIVYTSFEPAASTDLTAVASYGVEPYSYDWSDGQSGQTITVDPTSTQTYTVEVTDAEGCTTTASTTVLVTDVDITCPNNNNSVKVTLCHDGQEICVSENAVQAHLNHGDFLGSCDPDFDCGTAPLCDAALKVPAPEATDVSVDIEIVWSAASGLVGGYYLSVGTTNGGIDILDNVDVGNTLEYDLSGLLDFETTYYVTVIAYNDNGVATNCQANDYFTTEESPCNQATFTLCGNTYSGSTVGLPVQNGLSCDISLDTSGGAWYLLIGNGNEVTVDTNGSSFDTKLAVFSGSCDALVCIDGEDGFGNGGEDITFVSTPGIPYYIYVTGWLANEGNYNLNVNCTAPPTCDDGIQNGNETGVDCGGDCDSCVENDECSEAIDLVVGTDLSCSNAVFGTTEGASQSLPGILCDGFTGSADDDVWYSFTATGSEHTIIIQNVSGTSDIVTEVFDACGGNSIACQDIPNSPIELTGLTSGEDYYFRIYSYSSTASSSFNVCVGTPQPPTPEDECGGIYVDSGGVSGSYSTNEFRTTTILPDVAGEAVTITFTYVDIESSSSGSGTNSCWDFLTIYNGPSTSSPVLAQTLCGEESGDGGTPSNASSLLSVGMSFTSTDPSGALTIVFDSDGSVNETGWIADITCGSSRSSASTTADWNLFPNPSSTGEVQLDLTNYLNQDVSIQMTDFSGKVLVDKNETNLQTPRYRLSTSGMAYGMYFVRVATEAGVSTKKLMIANK